MVMAVVSTEQWHHLKAGFDWQNSRVAGIVDNTLIGTISLTKYIINNFFGNLAIYGDNQLGIRTVYFDNVSITKNRVELNNGLLAYYPFEGNANDDSGSGNHGAEQGGVNYVSGVNGQAANFDGVDDYISLPNSLDTLKSNNAKSVFAWVKIPAGVSSAECSGWGYLRSVVDNSPAGHWRYLGIHIRDGVYKAASGIQAHQTYVEGDTLTPDTWHLIGFTWSPDSTLKVYTDNNAPVSSPNTIPTWDTVAGSTFIGRQYSNPCGHYFKGAIKDVRFYDRQLNDSEVEALYNSGNAAP